MKTLLAKWNKGCLRSRSQHLRLELLLRIAAALAWNAF